MPEGAAEQSWSAGPEPTFLPDCRPWEYIGPEEVEPPLPEFTVSPLAVQKLSR